MVYLDSTLCLEYSELVPVIMKRDNYDYHKGRGNFTTHGYGGSGRKVLVEYESMPDKQRAEVKNYYGCPYIYASKQPILQSLEFDSKAQSYYQGYSLPNGTKLPSSNFNLNGKKQINYVERYTECATWLNMLIRLINDKIALKRELNISVGKFWETACDMIKTKKVSLPATPKRLKIKIKDYQIGSYEALIEKHKFGNSYSKKVVGEVAEALLKQLLSLRNKHADTTIAEEYNKWQFLKD